jgi:hypothetical protein
MSYTHYPYYRTFSTLHESSTASLSFSLSLSPIFSLFIYYFRVERKGEGERERVVEKAIDVKKATAHRIDLWVPSNFSI